MTEKGRKQLFRTMEDMDAVDSWVPVEENFGIGGGTSTRRLRVPGGWLYKVETYEGESTTSVNVTFVPYAET